MNPNNIKEARLTLEMFSTDGKKPLEILEQKKEKTLKMINKKLNDPSFNKFNDIKQKMSDTGL